jgi:hypothetical protein
MASVEDRLRRSALGRGLPSEEQPAALERLAKA